MKIFKIIRKKQKNIELYIVFKYYVFIVILY